MDLFGPNITAKNVGNFQLHTYLLTEAGLGHVFLKGMFILRLIVAYITNLCFMITFLKVFHGIMCHAL